MFWAAHLYLGTLIGQRDSLRLLPPTHRLCHWAESAANHPATSLFCVCVCVRVRVFVSGKLSNPGELNRPAVSSHTLWASAPLSRLCRHLPAANAGHLLRRPHDEPALGHLREPAAGEELHDGAAGDGGGEDGSEARVHRHGYVDGLESWSECAFKIKCHLFPPLPYLATRLCY